MSLVAALRVDGSSLHDVELSPKAAIVFAPAATQSVRFTFGHAFETGSLVHYFTRTAAAPPVSLRALQTALAPAIGGVDLHFDAIPVLALGNDRLRVERVDTLEAGYSGVLGRRTLVTGSYYFNRVTDLITPLLPQVGTELGRINPQFAAYAPPASLSPVQQALVLGALRASLPANLLPLLSNDPDGMPIFAVASYTNFAGAHLQGIELSAQHFASRRVVIEGGYSFLHFSPRPELSVPIVSANAAEHKITAGLTYTAARWSGSLRGRWTDAFIWNGGVYRGIVPAAAIMDAAADARMTSRLRLRVDIANALDNRHYEIFGGDLLPRRAMASLLVNW
jgi:outer membrane receptor protein involved in Fe transport